VPTVENQKYRSESVTGQRSNQMNYVLKGAILTFSS